LYYRLNVVRVEVPPLRERREDIPLLAGFLLEKLRVRMNKGETRLGASAIEALMGYSFPGNVRELENILERALIYGEGDEILASDLDFAEGRRAEPARAGTPRTDSARVEDSGAAVGAAVPATSLDSMESDAIRRALAKWGGNRSKAAEELGISRRTIQNKIKKYGLE